VSITVYPITPEFVAEVGDVDLSLHLANEDWEALRQAFWKYAVLIFPDQHLTPEAHAAFAERFGPIETDSVLDKQVNQMRVGSKFTDQSNLDDKGQRWEADSRRRMYKMGNRLWHTDSSFKRTPGLCSLLYCNQPVPLGGHTEFADQRAAYDALPMATRRRLQGLVAEHSIFTSRARLGFTEFSAEERERLPPVPQVLVRTVPESGRKSLYVAAHAGRIFGMPEGEGRAMIDQLIAHVTQRQFVYTHRWRLHDLVLWDNRCTMHRGTEFDDLRWTRDLRRATVSDIANSCEQEGVRAPG
jgi:alpha-ketoglutarate-dependent 2,4-dichlorophenoxyacetate dioxygenase